MPVQLPLDHLLELWPNKFRGARIGALVHPASISSKLEHASRILERHNGDLFRLATFFGPQHGFLGQTQDNMVEWQTYQHPRLRIPVYSLYGDHREPTAEMLEGLDVLLVGMGTGAFSLRALIAKAQKLVQEGRLGAVSEIQASWNNVSQASELEVLRPVLSADVLVLDELGEGYVPEAVEELLVRPVDDEPAVGIQGNPHRPDRAVGVGGCLAAVCTDYIHGAETADRDVRNAVDAGAGSVFYRLVVP